MTDRLDLPRRCREELEALLREHMPNAEVRIAPIKTLPNEGGRLK